MIYTIATAKGGTGKTTTAAALTQAAAYTGGRALAIDIDPQGSLSYALAGDATQPGSYALLHGTPAADLVQHSPQGLDIITASPDLQTETSAAGSARRLQAALKPIKDDYSIIVIDTPATAGELQYNALQAADRLIIVLEADGFNMQALYQIADTARQIQSSNSSLKIAGLIIARYERTNFNKYMRDQIEQTAAALDIPFLGIVRKGTAAREATAGLQQSLFEYAPRSNPALDYMQIFETLTK